MEIDNQTAQLAYIQMLIDIQKKKIIILNELLKMTEQQEALIAFDNFNEDEFLNIITAKDEKINQLTSIDDGFVQLYDRVKQEISEHKQLYANQINVLKEMIAEITDLSVKIQALEKRNRTKMEAYFSKKRKEIGSSRASGKTVTNYYKSMANQHEVQSFFYDKKN